jgi:hypothetical protein
LFIPTVGIVTSLLIQLDGGAAVYQARLELVNHYMAHRRLPPNLRQRIRDNYEFRWATHKAFDEVRHKIKIQKQDPNLRNKSNTISRRKQPNFDSKAQKRKR